MREQQFHPVTRPLTAADFNQVVRIDTGITGHARPGFFDKRLAAALADPGYFIYIGCDIEGALKGFLLARLQEGEYGIPLAVAELDAIGVDPDCMGLGIGTAMMQEFQAILRHKQVQEFHTQVEWRNVDFLRFLSAFGFQLAPRQVLERAVGYTNTLMGTDPVKVDTSPAGERNFSDPSSDEAVALARDLIDCRSLQAGDLPALVRIDRKLTGSDHRGYYQRKLKEALDESGIRVSLVAEQGGQVLGFVMARVDYGEFGRTEPVAVLDVIAVDPDFGRNRIGNAMLAQLLANLATLKLETVRTEIDMDHLDVLQFLLKNGFHHSQRLAFSYLL